MATQQHGAGGNAAGRSTAKQENSSRQKQQHTARGGAASHGDQRWLRTAATQEALWSAVGKKAAIAVAAARHARGRAQPRRGLAGWGVAWGWLYRMHVPQRRGRPPHLRLRLHLLLQRLPPRLAAVHALPPLPHRTPYCTQQARGHNTRAALTQAKRAARSAGCIGSHGGGPRRALLAPCWRQLATHLRRWEGTPVPPCAPPPPPAAAAVAGCAARAGVGRAKHTAVGCGAGAGSARPMQAHPAWP